MFSILVVAIGSNTLLLVVLQLFRCSVQWSLEHILVDLRINHNPLSTIILCIVIYSCYDWTYFYAQIFYH